jgi:hypothetical protein
MIQSPKKSRAITISFITMVVCILVWFIRSEASFIQRNQILTSNQAKDRVISTLYQGEIGNRALFVNPQVKVRGSHIASWRDPSKLKVNKDSWFFFVDEQPGANWEHRARYVLVEKGTGVVRSYDAKTPPREILELKAENSLAEKHLKMLKMTAKFYSRVRVPRVIKLSRQKKYAVLVSGGWDSSHNYSRYWNDLAFIFMALKKKYRYNDEEIIVLYANGVRSPNGDLDGNRTNDIDYAATKANLTNVMNFIGANITKTGKFFFYSTNHGGQESEHDAYLYLWGESIQDDELAALSRNIKCGEAIYVMEQCYSGGMMDDLLTAQTYPCTNPKLCIMTAANYNEPSWSCDTEGSYDEYVYHWTSAIFGATPTGARVNADINGDRKVSMNEAHLYAKDRDSRDEHPTSGSCVPGGCNETLSPKLIIKKRLSIKK